MGDADEGRVRDRMIGYAKKCLFRLISKP